MHLLIARLLFILVLLAVSVVVGKDKAQGAMTLYFIFGSLGLGLLVIGLDILARDKSVATLSVVFFGLLGGLLTAWLLSNVIEVMPWEWARENTDEVTAVLTVMLSYVFISVIMQTKDDFRFVIPYIEFAREAKGGSPLVLDTSVIIDGRIADLCETRIFASELIVPRFVLQELQSIADSGDKLKRNRGRRGLDVLNRLQTNENVDIRIYDGGTTGAAPAGDVDSQLVQLAQELSGRVVTNDYNLNKVAAFRGVPVINLNDMANALKPVFLPGESLEVDVIKPGEEPGQGVGYLEDGTMVVVEGARESVGRRVSLLVTSVLQTSAGRMVFGRLSGSEGGNGGGRPGRPRNDDGGRGGRS